MPVSPMMQQYLLTKEKYQDCILLYRLGDFYEMFFDDAIEISKALGLTLTGRDCGLDERAPMCGIPYHALDTYMSKLLELGYKVAICEQLTPPDKGSIVERDVVRVVTPGTVMEESILRENKYNYIASVYYDKNCTGISWADISTGDFFCMQCGTDFDNKALQDILVRIMPSEIICSSEIFTLSNQLPVIKMNFIPKFTCYSDWAYDYDKAYGVLTKQLNVQSLDSFGLKHKRAAVSAAGALISYFNDTQKRSLSHINKLLYKDNGNYMALDMNTRRNLELTATLQDRKKYGSLLWLLDNTKTSMGARNLTLWIEQPLQDIHEINERLDAVEEIKKNLILAQQLSDSLSNIRDIERLTGKVSYNSVTPKDVETLGKSLEFFPAVQSALLGCKSPLLKELSGALAGLEHVSGLIEKAITPNAPITQKDGGFIRYGYDKELDALIDIKEHGQNWIAQLEVSEREKTGIKGLKVGYNRVFGYYIEITNSYTGQVPYYFTRKQTLANCERYITDELKGMEDKILNASDNLIKLEIRVFGEIRNFLLKNVEHLQRAAKSVAIIDTLLSFAIVANRYRYARPKMSVKDRALEIKNGRHPVVEALLKGEQFVPNDTFLDSGDSRAMVITGPNMSGKSTYMRQVAIITLMAHIGSFVPADSAKVMITDKIFTRVGASDNLAFSQSTFMVEMTEVANILNNATNDSLIILDEVGRGTSTYDGMSIAWSVMQYLAENTSAKVLFATHYHELIELEHRLPGVKNYKVMVKELADGVIFLRKIVRGGADKSFGIEVAKLAGLPAEVVANAKQLMDSLSSPGEGEDERARQAMPVKYLEVINILKDLDINNCTPILAFDMLIDLKNRVK